MKVVESLLALSLTSCALSAQTSPTPEVKASPSKGECGLIYGDSHAISICAPNGWILDNRVLSAKGIYAVFYRPELGYEQAKAHASIMYVNVMMKEEGQSSADEVRKADITDTKLHAPQATVAQDTPITIAAAPPAPSRVIPVESFANAYEGAWEAVAYVEDEKTISLVVLTSASEASFKADYASFVELLRSYKFLGSNVTIKK